MGHCATVGMTESGKTTLERARAAYYMSKGWSVLVLDPFYSPDWPCDWMTADLAPFIWKARRSFRCALFVEESGNFGRDPRFEWLFTQSRHWGHVVHYVSQYHSQVPPIVRTNCERLCLFRVSGYSAKVWAREFGQPEIQTLAENVPQFHYVAANRFAQPKVQTLAVGAVSRLSA